MDSLFLNGLQPTPIPRFTTRLVVHDYECAMLYRRGRFASRLDAGSHRIWGTGHAFTRVDLRRFSLTISGQEVLSADQISLKISLAVTLQITDPIKALHAVRNWNDSVYQIIQLSLRTVVSKLSTEELVQRRTTIGTELMATAVPQASEIGVSIVLIAFKDVMFPGDLKKAFADILKAKHEGQAALERARGETAALRNLANAARVLDGNPALQNLRVLQTVAAAGQAGSTLVMGLPSAFVSVPAGRSSAQRTTEESEQ